jgi:hypothetical protein
MKKRILILAGIIGFIGLFAQNRLNIHLQNTTVEHVTVSDIDSMYIGGNDTMLNVRLINQTVKEFPIPSIDSLTFSDTVSSLPVVQTIPVDRIAQESARSGIIIVSRGASTVTARGICWSTTEHPTIADSKYSSPLSATNQYINASFLMGSTTYYVRAFATNSYGTSYGETFSFTTTAYTLPIVETTSVTYSGGLAATCVGNVSNSGGYSKYIARGFCWSTSSNPTLSDNVVVHSSILLGSYSMNIVFPTTNVTYYVRAYTTNTLGTTYGTVLSVKPIMMGNLTYTIDTNTLPVGSANYNLMKIALDSAMYYYNRYANFSGNIWVYYDAGIPTAQGGYRSSIGFGSNTWYMHVSTVMHEIAHWLGSGTTTSWKSHCVNGLWNGPTAVALLKSLTGETLYCDNNANLWHFWPYGLNQRSEATSANVYIIHAKLLNAMKTDCGW